MTAQQDQQREKKPFLKKRPLSGFLPVEIFNSLRLHQAMSIGTLLTALLAISPLLVWVGTGADIAGLGLVVILAKINAFLALSTLSLNFVLAVRSNFMERLFGGLDRLYRIHKLVGRLSLVFMLLHPFCLGVKFYPDQETLMGYVLPVAYWDVAMGVLAVYLFLFLLALTVSFNIPYHRWKQSHKLLGLVLLMALLHAVFAGSQVQANPALEYYLEFIASVGLIAWLYMLLLYQRLGARYNVRVLLVRHTPSVSDIYLSKPEGFNYHPGQFLFISFLGLKGGKEFFPFSISSDPSQLFLRLSIRGAGDFTKSEVPKLKEWDQAVIMGPYGSFGERYLEHARDMVWLAGGIGITPFLSIAKHESLYPTGRKIELVWANRSSETTFHERELQEESGKNPLFDYQHWYTGEKGRMSAEDIMEMVGGKEELVERVFFLCGPPGMMESLAKGLHGLGVPYRNIVYEDFDMLD